MTFRIEQKLHIHSSSEMNLYSWLHENRAIELYPERTINSIYFDTTEKNLYWDSTEGILPRKKIRIRCYGNCNHKTGDHIIETKISSVEGRYKTTSYIANPSNAIKIGLADIAYGQLFPILEISYTRKYFEIFGVRLTLDNQIRYSEFNLDHTSELKIFDPRIVVEIKADFETSENFLNEKFPFPRIRFSKYAFAVEALNMKD